MKAELVLSAPSVEGLPRTRLAEVAVVGKSNVGKSSLLNALTNTKIARTSKTPGRTQLLNLFRVESGPERFGLMDLPGYGFAAAPPAIRAAWMEMIEQYLERREELALVLLLVDVRRAADDEDRDIFTWLEGLSRVRALSVLAVGTKLDKLSKAHQKPAADALARSLGIQRTDVLLTSAQQSAGLDALRARIREALPRSFVPGRADRQVP